MGVQVQTQKSEGVFFNYVLSKLQEWKETVMIAAKVLGVDQVKVQEALDYIESIEEEVLRLSLFY